MALAAPEAQATAKSNAKQVEGAMLHASKTPLLGQAMTLSDGEEEDIPL